MPSISYQDLGVDYQDAGPWRSYSLDTYGETFEEMMYNATISEVDQDGGELRCYGIDRAYSKVFEAVVREIRAKLFEDGSSL